MINFSIFISFALLFINSKHKHEKKHNIFSKTNSKKHSNNKRPDFENIPYKNYFYFFLNQIMKHRTLSNSKKISFSFLITGVISFIFGFILLIGIESPTLIMNLTFILWGTFIIITSLLLRKYLTVYIYIYGKYSMEF